MAEVRSQSFANALASALIGWHADQLRHRHDCAPDCLWLACVECEPQRQDEQRHNGSDFGARAEEEQIFHTGFSEEAVWLALLAQALKEEWQPHGVI